METCIYSKGRFASPHQAKSLLSIFFSLPMSLNVFFLFFSSFLPFSLFSLCPSFFYLFIYHFFLFFSFFLHFPFSLPFICSLFSFLFSPFFFPLFFSYSLPFFHLLSSSFSFFLYLSIFLPHSTLSFLSPSPYCLFFLIFPPPFSPLVLPCV